MLEIMITTYETYRRTKDDINTVAWDCVITDECHKIKERKSAVTKAMNEINALCRIGLTGTAIQNKYDELWTLLNWSCPGTFGPISQWRVTISEPLKAGQSHEATAQELARARKTATQLVQNLLPQFFLRRMKTLIRDQLPKKTDRVVFCPLTPDQADAYLNFLESDFVTTIKRSPEVCECGEKRPTHKRGSHLGAYLENGDKWQEWVFPCIAYLQRLSNHLALLIPSARDEKKKQAKDTELLQISCPDHWQDFLASKDSILNYSNPEYCGKWRVLRKLLKFWYEQGNNKVLIFSHSVKLLQMLKALFLHTDHNLKYLDGSMTYDERYEAVKEFNTDPTQFVFLISTRAGGVGLNITSANKVVVVDPNWNPSYDLQAQDRAYRIGQTRDVEVFRLVSQGTLEEIIYARQIYKQQMSNIGLAATSERRYFAGIQDRPSQKGEIFGLQNLFAYQDENVVLRDIVHKTNVAEAKADLRIAELSLEDDEAQASSGSEHDDDTREGTTSVSQSRTEARADEAMSQLAADIIGTTSKRGQKEPSTDGTSFTSSTLNKRHDAVNAILASAGVSYTHENSEVVGSSRVEGVLSKRALAAGKSQQAARVFKKDTQSQNKSHRGVNVEEHGEFRYKYRPPEDVRKRQFCSMAAWAGHGATNEGVIDFALTVESWTQAERRDFLEKWYRYRRGWLMTDVNDVVMTYDAVNDEKSDIKDENGKEVTMKIKCGTEDRGSGTVKLEVKKEIKAENLSDIKPVMIKTGDEEDTMLISSDDEL